VAVLVATHDPEFAAGFATRAILLADGRVVADASPAELLSGGWYFATETARILGGHRGILTAAEAVAELGAGRAALGSLP
jgi:energy-coupling factor transport system ATP-binding protein